MKRGLFLSAAAATLLAVALQISSGLFDPTALVFVTLGTGIAILAALQRASGDESWAQLALGVGLLHGLICQIFVVPTFYADPRALQGFHALAILATVFVSAYLCVHLRASLQRLRFAGSLALFAAMGVAVLHASPAPHIDVFYLRSGAASALAHGLNPYSISYPELYPGDSVQLYGDEFVHGGRIWFYPYPPLVAFIDMLWPRDPRLISLVAIVIAAWAIARIGENVISELAAMLLLFQGRSFFVLEQAWTEPLTLAAFALAVLFIVRGLHWWWSGLALGVCAASKQYSPLLLVPLLPHVPRRGLAIAAGVLAASLGPFFLWNAGDLWSSLVASRLSHAVRTDSLSLLALWGRLGELPSWALVPSFVAALLVLAVSWRGARRARAVTTTAAAWLVFVLLNKQAFCNYDWLGVGLLCVAIALWSRPEEKVEA
jgi:hypothetical protein